MDDFDTIAEFPDRETAQRFATKVGGHVVPICDSFIVTTEDGTYLTDKEAEKVTI